MTKFNQRKESMLSKEDKSSKGDWDEKILSLCEKLNSFENYYTTSSCSGRILVMKDEEKKGPGLFEFVSHEKVDFKEFMKKIENFGGELKFKQVPFIIHVSCLDIESAKELMEKGLKAGIKQSGIISLGENIIVELKSTEKLEFPLVEKGEFLVSKMFLKKVIEKSNDNLENGWKKIKRLFNLL